MKVEAIGLFVENMAVMVPFYRDVLGMRTDWNGEPDADLDAGGVRLIMYSREDFARMTSRKFAYHKGLNGTMEIAFEMPHFCDVDKEYERLLQAGAGSVLPPVDEPWGQRTSYVSDPEGNLLEIGSFNRGNPGDR